MTLEVISTMMFCATMYFYKTMSFKQVGSVEWGVTKKYSITNMKVDSNL